MQRKIPFAMMLNHPLCRITETTLPVWLLAIVLLVSGWPAKYSAAQSRTEVIAVSTQSAPDGNGAFTLLDQPVMNRFGQIAFTGTIGGTTVGLQESGVFFADGNGLHQIARRGQSAPGGNGAFLNMGSQLTLNNSGQIAFSASLAGTSGGINDNRGIFVGSNSSIVQMVRRGQAAPDGNGTLQDFVNIGIGGGGVTFLGVLAGTTGGATSDGIFRQSGGTFSQVVRQGQTAPGSGTYNTLSTSIANISGDVAFVSSLQGTSGGGNSVAIFRTVGNTIFQVARLGQVVPGGNGTISAIGSSSGFFSHSDSGDVAFFSALTGTSGGTNDDRAIFRGNGGSLTQIAREGQSAPNGNGFFRNFANLDVNASGQVVFRAELSGTSGGSNDNDGIFRGSGGAITQIARAGQVVLDGNGAFANFATPTINNFGQSIFIATLVGGGRGIFTGDGIDVLSVARNGDSILGATIDSVSFTPDGLNDLGQVAYRATLNDGRIAIGKWTPDLKWRSSASGSWDTVSNWTLGLRPDQPHDVFINPAASLTVTGPATSRLVRSLQIGGGTGLARMELRNGSEFTATHGVKIESTGTLTGDGVIAGELINRGVILANNLTVNGLLTNHNILRGNGRVHADIVNSLTGRVRAVGGEELWLSGDKFHNSGFVDVHQAELQIDASDFLQTSTGVLSLRSGTLIFGNGVFNDGRVVVNQGPSSIQGNVHNTGTIQVSGDASATFFGDLIQNGILELAKVGNTSSSAVALGSFSGSGGFTGGGDLFVLGELQPGNSADSVLFDGNLFLGTTASTMIELGGLEFGDFDQMVVKGDLNLSGNLLVSLIDGHLLGLNQQYLIGDIGGNLFGQFTGLDEGALVGTFGDVDLFISYRAGSGNDIALFTPVPEPNSAILLAVAMMASGIRLRRTQV